MVKKRYLAWIEGTNIPPTGHLLTRIGKDTPLGGRPRYKVTNNPTDQTAETEWEVVKKEPHKTLLALYPITGRTHQLRVHMAHLGYPILGDSLYHPKGTASSSRLLLHAESLSFPHPFTGRPLSLYSRLEKELTIFRS